MNITRSFAEGFKNFKLPTGFLLILVQLAALVAVLYGISSWSVPAAYIVGGVAIVLAIEMQNQGPREDPAEEALIRAKIDSAIKQGKNSFTEPGVPMSPKWINYVSMFVNRSS